MRMAILVSISFLLTFFFVTSLYAYEPERATNNLAHEYAECAAYFFVTSKVPGLPENAKEAYNDRAEAAVAISVKLTSDKLTVARVQLSTKDIMKEMDNDWGNSSIIINKYLDKCTGLMKDPRERMAYYLNKKDD